MGERIRKMAAFSIFEHEKELEWLREQHKTGYKFTGFGYLGTYLFEKCEPEDVIYQMDYTQDASNRLEYLQMFQDCGWEFILENHGEIFFRKSVSQMNGEEEIFGDLDSKVKMTGRMFFDAAISKILLFLLFIVPGIRYMFLNGKSFVEILFSGHGVIAVLYFLIIGQYVFHYFQVKKDGKRGRKIIDIPMWMRLGAIWGMFAWVLIGDWICDYTQIGYTLGECAAIGAGIAVSYLKEKEKFTRIKV